MVVRWPHPKSIGTFLWTPLPRFASKNGVWPKPPPRLPRRDLWPRSVASSFGVQSVRWLISALWSTAGSQLWLAIAATRFSKTTWRLLYSCGAPPGRNCGSQSLRPASRRPPGACCTPVEHRRVAIVARNRCDPLLEDHLAHAVLLWSTAGSQLWLAIAATRFSKTTWRMLYSCGAP